MKVPRTTVLITLDCSGHGYDALDYLVDALTALMDENKVTGKHYLTGSVALDGVINVTTKQVCEHCLGDGEIAQDEDDGEGHIMRGVNIKKCICQK